ncbi:MAG: YkgJ family cysteine cluster protein [Verrucomicrobiota bacterium]|nr:YkgJ family cysteine cluster protein [Verrucomicrobiota bacterium]
MNGTCQADDENGTELCTTCGLCCNGVLFADVRFRPGDDIARLRSLGLPVKASQSATRLPRFTQPCAAFDGFRCCVYTDRPSYCREFECALLQNFKTGCTELDAARRIIRTARERAEKISSLLEALGDRALGQPLSIRFRNASKHITRRNLDEATAETYSRLTLAVHDLNLLLSSAFYPRSTNSARKIRARRTVVAAASVIFALFFAYVPLLADLVELRNGDRYVGQVLSLDTNTVVLQSGVLGLLQLPRSQVARMTIGSMAATNSSGRPLAVSVETTNAAVELPPVLRGLASSSNLIQQVQRQFLSKAGPEANDKFTELLGDLLSGRLSVADIRTQARAVADQLRELKREEGGQMGFMIDAYLAILDRFIGQTSQSDTTINVPTTLAGSNAPPVQRKK